MAIIRRIWSIVNSCISAYTWVLKNNANNDIKQAESLLAKYQISKIHGKPGTGSDKSILSKKTSKAFNAFIVGTTSYNTAEASARAHELGVRETEKQIQYCIIVQMLFNCVILLLTGQLYKIPMVVAGVLITLVSDVDRKQLIMHMINMITAEQWILRVLEAIYMTAAVYDVVPGFLREIHAFIYAVMATIIAVFL